METSSAHSEGSLRVRTVADAVLTDSGLWENPYFAELRDGRMSREAFCASQEQFYFAVTFFSRPMAGLIARSADYAARLDVLRNVVEEHGDFNLKRSHGATFEAFLRTLGSDVAAVRSAQVIPAVHAFNSVLFSACMLEELEVGIACMGIIEHAFAALSAQIGQAVVERGWVSRDALNHYATHAELDVRHADEFFCLLKPTWNDPRAREFAERGLRLGAHVFDRLYRELHAHGKAA